jgi:hypothetical protein
VPWPGAPSATGLAASRVIPADVRIDHAMPNVTDGAGTSWAVCLDPVVRGVHALCGQLLSRG